MPFSVSLPLNGGGWKGRGDTSIMIVLFAYTELVYDLTVTVQIVFL